jgi:hypothetical protein
VATETSNHFPPDVRLALLRAASTPVSGSDPFARVKAINAVIERARLRFPQLFRELNHANDRSE